jgi:dephospho-CoA kinase
MTVVALTGGIAAGKSTVTRVFRELGLHVIDADQLARDAVGPDSPILFDIRERFGDDIVTSGGQLDRAKLGALIFQDETARLDLNRIVHPEVARLYHGALRHAQERFPSSVIVYEVPLLAEARKADEFDLVIVVHTPWQERVDRLMAQRGLSKAEALGRIQAQTTDEERLALADVVLDSSTSEEDTIDQARRLASVLKRCWPDRLRDVPQQFAVETS